MGEYWLAYLYLALAAGWSLWATIQFCRWFGGRIWRLWYWADPAQQEIQRQVREGAKLLLEARSQASRENQGWQD